jgi:hypothetical protein
VIQVPFQEVTGSTLDAQDIPGMHVEKEITAIMPTRQVVEQVHGPTQPVKEVDGGDLGRGDKHFPGAERCIIWGVGPE